MVINNEKTSEQVHRLQFTAFICFLCLRAKALQKKAPQQLARAKMQRNHLQQVRGSQNRMVFMASQNCIYCRS